MSDPEKRLFQAYGEIPPGKSGLFRVHDASRIEPCQCGGFIAIRSEDEIEAAVFHHNQSVLHRSWQDWLEGRGEIDSQ